MNYDNLLIVNKMFRHVRKKYYKEPSICQYYAESIVWSLLYNPSDLVKESRMVISLA